MVFVGVAGCGKYYWYKPETTVEQFRRDSQMCAHKASTPSVTTVGIGLDQKAYRNCLSTLGYVRQQKATQQAGWYRGIE